MVKSGRAVDDWADCAVGIKQPWANSGPGRHKRKKNSFKPECRLRPRFPWFNNMRRQTLNITNTLITYSLNTSVIYKMKGPKLSDGYSIFNSPEQLRANLLASNPNASAQDLYNQYRQGFGSTNITSVLDPRRIEIGMRFKF